MSFEKLQTCKLSETCYYCSDVVHIYLDITSYPYSFDDDIASEASNDIIRTKIKKMRKWKMYIGFRSIIMKDFKFLKTFV